MSKLTLENMSIMQEMLQAIKSYVSLKDENMDFFMLNPNWNIWAQEFDLSKENIQQMIGSEKYCQENPLFVEEVIKSLKS